MEPTSDWGGPEFQVPTDNCAGAASSGRDLWLCSKSFVRACAQHHLEIDSFFFKSKRVLVSGGRRAAKDSRTHAIGESVTFRISAGAAMPFTKPILEKSSGGRV